jgi:hypothetical protein
MDKVLKLISKLSKDLNKDWSEDLKRINIYQDVDVLYSTYDMHHANCILAFIIFSFHSESERLELHKDRLENKTKIMCSLVGDWAMTIKEFKDSVDGNDKAANEVINWIFEYQKDWRWTQVELDFSYHAQIREMTKSISSTEDAKDALQKGKCIEEALKRRRQGEALLKEMQQDYMNLDTIAKQENRNEPTKEIKGIMSWEDHKRNKKGS